MNLNSVWKDFEKTGDITSYLLYKQVQDDIDDIDNPDDINYMGVVKEENNKEQKNAGDNGRLDN